MAESEKPYALMLLEESEINPQNQSPLFSVLPKEIRDLVFEHVLAAYPNPRHIYEAHEPYARPGLSGKLRVAIELLYTCKAVYVETYQLPITLNPVIAYHVFEAPPDSSGLEHLRLLLPWQYAALHMLDITLQQSHLECGRIGSYAVQLQAKQRYNGLSVHENPFTQNEDMSDDEESDGWSHEESSDEGVNYDGTSEEENSNEEISDEGASKVEESGVHLTTDLPGSASAPPRLSGLLLPSQNPTVARCIDRLTLRIGRTEWWTWEDPPNSTDQLALDPGFGRGGTSTRCTTLQMLAEAEKRRQGQWNGWRNRRCWGAQVAQFKGLKCLELVLETFAAKMAQLDTVVECAKSWRFPMGDGDELRFAGDMVASTWVGVDGYGYEESNPWLFEANAQPAAVELDSYEHLAGPQSDGDGGTISSPTQPLPDARLFEVRTIRFKRRRVGS